MRFSPPINLAKKEKRTNCSFPVSVLLNHHSIATALRCFISILFLCLQHSYIVGKRGYHFPTRNVSSKGGNGQLYFPHNVRIKVGLRRVLENGMTMLPIGWSYPLRTFIYLFFDMQVCLTLDLHRSCICTFSSPLLTAFLQTTLQLMQLSRLGGTSSDFGREQKFPNQCQWSCHTVAACKAR